MSGASLILAQAAEDVFSALGEDATFTPAVGDAVSLKVNLGVGVEYQPGSIESQVWGSEKTIEYVLVDIGREVNRDETFTLGSTVYTVQGIEQNDGRFVKVVVTG